MNDTIAAISTALGKGSISIIRVSGLNSIDIVNKIFKGNDLTKVDTHTINYGYITQKDNLIDEVLVSVMKSPKTFTTEDIVEINCHGGIIVTNKILELLLENGCRIAEPGEFSKRAFLNNRISLTQAEAIMDLIESKSNKASKMALNQLRGNIYNKILSFQNKILTLISEIEVNIDYPEYYDIEVMTNEKIKLECKQLQKEIKNILKVSKTGKIYKEGIKTAIIGRPNVGKSSLLNALLEEEKAIVTDIEGTTRDIVEGSVQIDNVFLNMIDTAGIRNTDDIIEKKGVEKSLELIDDCDLILLVLNGNEKLQKNDLSILNKVNPKKTIVIVNKSDLKENIELNKLKNFTIVKTSTKMDNGIQLLKDKIKEQFDLEKIENSDQTYLTNVRQINLMKQISKILDDILEKVNNIEVDLLAIDLRNIYNKLDEINGKIYDDDIINHLFENFCVGK